MSQFSQGQGNLQPGGMSQRFETRRHFASPGIVRWPSGGYVAPIGDPVTPGGSSDQASDIAIDLPVRRVHDTVPVSVDVTPIDQFNVNYISIVATSIQVCNGATTQTLWVLTTPDTTPNKETTRMLVHLHNTSDADSNGNRPHIMYRQKMEGGAANIEASDLCWPDIKGRVKGASSGYKKWWYFEPKLDPGCPSTSWDEANPKLYKFLLLGSPREREEGDCSINDDQTSTTFLKDNNGQNTNIPIDPWLRVTVRNIPFKTPTGFVAPWS